MLSPETEVAPVSTNFGIDSAQAIGITSYSALFNTNPFFAGPNVIVLDDAHTSEGYISELWTVRISHNKADHKPLHDAVAALLAPHLGKTEAQRVRGEWETSFDRLWVDTVPAPRFHELVEEFTAIVDAYASDLDLRFGWQMLRNNLHACHLYIGAGEMLLRPLIPPTAFQRPFASAHQRIYMSATFGESGDLERITGRRAIKRIDAPAGFERQGVGRRFFLLPEISLDEVDGKDFVSRALKRAGRALYIVPSIRAANR